MCGEIIVDIAENVLCNLIKYINQRVTYIFRGMFKKPYVCQEPQVCLACGM